MAETPESVQQKIAELEAIRPVIGDEAADAAISVLKSYAQPPFQEVSGTSDINRDNYGQNVGVNFGTLIAIFGEMSENRKQILLKRYLHRLTCNLDQVALRGLERRTTQQKQKVALPRVYTLLATTERIQVARGHPTALTTYLDLMTFVEEQGLRSEYTPNYALPDQAIIHIEREQMSSDEYSHDQIPISLWRAQMATEAVALHHRLILLGDPGGGKSTFLRHLGWLVAQHQRGRLSGADKTLLPSELNNFLPIILPLPRLARALLQTHETNVSPAIAVQDMLRTIMQECEADELADHLDDILYQGAALVLLDGLDEVPIDAQSSDYVDRITTLRAVEEFSHHNQQTRIVITCRTRAFELLESALYDDWHIATLAPFTLGQIRYFVDAWYEELGVSATIDSNQLSNLKEMLIKDIVRLPRLRDMAKTPLLLLMMVLVLYNKGKLPRELPKLYESILELLLGQWDCVRDGQTLADVLDLPDWTSERIRPVLDRLSYEAHRDATSTSIRGRIPRMTVEWELREHLIATGMLDDEAAKAAVRAVRYIEQRSGLLQPSAVDYEFAHLTLQEHCSGRHIVRQSNPLSFIMEHRVDDRWREPIFLGLGTIQESNPWLIESVMRRLIERETDRSIDQWYRDLIMAAEIGNDRDWAYLKEQGLDILALQRNLRLGLVTILEDKEHKVSTNERVRAGYLLCDLGDPRFPITQEQWKQEVEKALMGHTDGYFCRVEAGTYFIGGNENDAGVEDDEKPQHTITFYQPFWIARFPITNAQWQAWKTTSIKKAHRTYPDEMKRANHPIANVQWYWCYEFCMWLSKQIGMNIRMPSEAEWEAAARGNDVRLYPWGHEWRDDYSATAEDKERRGLPYSTPVGCYPAGAAPCGAMDMAGNMWEWTQSPYTKNHNPAQTTQLAANAKRFALKGGHHNESAIYARCSARNWSYPDSYGPNSFRVLLSLDPMKLT